jgi:hypothetical protein
MVLCSCFPTAASHQPRKVYNVLVPDVFPLQAPRLDEPINAGTKRKIGKLGEYVEKNPARIGKVRLVTLDLSRGLSSDRSRKGDAPPARPRRSPGAWRAASSTRSTGASMGTSRSRCTPTSTCCSAAARRT